MMYPLKIYPIKAFEDNYIWVLHQGRQVVVVDPGDSGPVLDLLKREDLELSAVLVTHHHGDHTGGIQDLVLAFPNKKVKIYGPANESIPSLSEPLLGNEKIRVEGIEVDFEILSIPGHTRGHLAFYGKQLGSTGSIFCGDTLFGAGCGRLFEGTPYQMQSSLAKIASLPPKTLCYCAHEYTLSNLRFAMVIEPQNLEIQKRIKQTQESRKHGDATVPFTLEGELLTNPFIRWDSPEVRLAASERLGNKSIDPVEIFATIRQWKDNFL